MFFREVGSSAAKPERPPWKPTMLLSPNFGSMDPLLDRQLLHLPLAPILLEFLARHKSLINLAKNRVINSCQVPQSSSTSTSTNIVDMFSQQIVNWFLVHKRR